MSMLSKFNLDDVFGAITDTELFEGSGTTTLTVGKRVPYAATINGISVPSYVTLHEARLTRISMLQQTQVATGREYWLATGIFKPVRMDIELIVDGETINLVDFLHQVAKAASNSEISREEFLINARRIGFNYAEGMPLFFQQFGASAEGFSHLTKTFREAGATDAISRIANPGRIKAAYDHKTGVPVTSFEIGTVDRAKSPRNQGFLNLVDAQIGQFSRILGLRKQAKVLKNQLNDTSKMSQEKIKGINGQIKNLTDMSRQQMSNWAGAQKRIINENGSFTELDQFDPVSAPVGRFNLLVEGEEVGIDLWSNSIRANTVTTAEVSDDKF